MNIRNELSFILQGTSPKVERHLVFSRELLKKKEKMLPIRSTSPLQQMFSARLKSVRSNTSKRLESSIGYVPISTMGNQPKTQREMFENSKESLKAIKELQDLCNEARMIHISSQISMAENNKSFLESGDKGNSSNKDMMSFKGSKVHSKNLTNPRFLDLSKKRRKSCIRPSPKSGLERCSSRNSQLSTKQSQNPELALPDLRILNSLRLSKDKSVDLPGKKKRYQLIHI